jgi:hypothetical protein
VSADADQFRKQAEECRQLAATALKAAAKAFWLRLADDWLRLAQRKRISRRSCVTRPQAVLAHFVGSIGSIGSWKRLVAVRSRAWPHQGNAAP